MALRKILRCMSHEKRPNLVTFYEGNDDAAMVIARKIPGHESCKIVVVDPNENRDTAYDEILAATPSGIFLYGRSEIPASIIERWLPR